jgi:hypothetical protein
MATKEWLLTLSDGRSDGPKAFLGTYCWTSGAKALSFIGTCGTAEAVPFPNYSALFSRSFLSLAIV